MTKQENHKILDKIEWEGFEYTFVGYSDWEEIKDAKFHKLRKAYKKAAEALAKYVGADVL
jgi:predicted RNA-binding protein (virulence factor B family)